VNTDLHAQAIDATVGHAEAVGAPASGVVDQIVAFEIASATAQSFDKKAGLLTANGGLGGPAALVKQPFHIGINDPAAAGFNPHAMSIYDAWAPSSAATTTAQQSIARGEQIFNNRKFTVMHVAGLNDVTGQPAIVATCTSCHNTPNVGNHSTAAFFDLGLTDTVRRTPDMPLYTLKNKTTGAIRETTDPGRAMVTGNWADIGKFKVPTLRGLAARAPYFHDGSAQDVNAVIGFYDRRFNIGFTPQERADLAAFLNSL
jgi:cytochrome c peroxidase